MRRAGMAAAIMGILGGCAAAEQVAAAPAPLLDLSGLVWLGSNRFLAVHDAKIPKEIDLPRVSILTLPASLEGIARRDVAPDFPGAKSSDLEAAAAVPGTTKVLLAESGDDAGPFDRIFLADVWGDRVEILGTVRWREFTSYYNIEAVAVAAPAGGAPPLFLWAERNSGKDATELKWTALSIEPFRIGGRVSAAAFSLPASARDGQGAPLYNRAIVALDVDADGGIYVASTFDLEEVSADPDNGPFRSSVYRIGRITGDDVVLDAEPKIIAVLDGLKVESLAVREQNGRREIFIGTDDENYGGILRLLPEPGSADRS